MSAFILTIMLTLFGNRYSGVVIPPGQTHVNQEDTMGPPKSEKHFPREAHPNYPTNPLYRNPEHKKEVYLINGHFIWDTANGIWRQIP